MVEIYVNLKGVLSNAYRYFGNNQIFNSDNFSNQFQKFQSYNIVDARFKKQSIFDQNQMNPYHLPPIKKRKHNELVRKVMYDENVKWEHEPVNYPPAVKQNGKKLLSLLEKEEMEKFFAMKLRRDPISLGDKVEIEYYDSITSKKLYRYKGVILEIKRPNSFTKSFKILLNLKNENYIAEYPMYSPMLHSVKLLGKSINNTRKTRIFNSRDLLKYGNKVERLLEGGRKLTMNKRDLKQMKMIQNTHEKIVTE
jgi:hypothetical protein